MLDPKYRARDNDALSRLAELTALFASLDALLREAVQEDDFQVWFESNPALFEILGFKRSIIKPRLMLGDGKYLET